MVTAWLVPQPCHVLCFPGLPWPLPSSCERFSRSLVSSLTGPACPITEPGAGGGRLTPVRCSRRPWPLPPVPCAPTSRVQAGAPLCRTALGGQLLSWSRTCCAPGSPHLPHRLRAHLNPRRRGEAFVDRTRAQGSSGRQKLPRAGAGVDFTRRPFSPHPENHGKPLLQKCRKVMGQHLIRHRVLKRDFNGGREPRGNAEV